MFNKSDDFTNTVAMTTADIEQRIKANAYKLFFSEFRKHLSSAQSSLRAQKEPTQEELRKIGAAFHLVRGGAGFFGLDDLARVSEKLEELLLENLSQSRNCLEQARKLLTEVEQIASSLPAPATPDPE